MSHPRLRGQVALITGATRGIGLAIAHALTAEGCKLILTEPRRIRLSAREPGTSVRKN